MSAPVLRFHPDGDGTHDVDLAALLAGRLLIQGSSGAGKSYLTRYMLEQTHGQIQQFIIDPEGEFATLRERFDYVLASAGDDGDVPADPKSARLLCRRLVELGASAILDLYELEASEREEFVGQFLRELINLPKDLWAPRLVVIDEAHEFAPQSPPKGHPSASQMRLLSSKGRKRGLGGVYLTTRMSKLDTSVAEAQNTLIGYTGLDVDVKRAGDVLGFDKAGREGLKRLGKGEFYAFGPALSREVVRVRSGQIQTTHPQVGELAPPAPPAPAAIRALMEQLEGLPEQAAEEERTLEALQGEVQDLRRQLRRAEKERPEPDPAAVQRQVDAAVERETARARGEVLAMQHKLARVEALGKQLVQAAHVNGDRPTAAAPPPPAPPRPAARAAASRPAAPPADSAPNVGAADLSGPDRKILGALSRFEQLGIERPERANVAALAGYSASGGTFNRYLSDLSSRELIDYPSPGTVALTPAGRAAAPAVDPIESLQELHDAWLSLRPIGGPHRKLLEELLRAYPDALTREELADATGYTASGGTFNRYMSTLSSLGLITYPDRGTARAAELLFPAGLR